MQDPEQTRRSLIARGFVLVCDYLLADDLLADGQAPLLFGSVVSNFIWSQPEELDVLECPARWQAVAATAARHRGSTCR